MKCEGLVGDEEWMYSDCEVEVVIGENINHWQVDNGKNQKRKAKQIAVGENTNHR